MEVIKAFQTAARKGGFIEVNEAADAGVWWLRKSAPGTSKDTHQLMCIDTLQNSVTVFWLTLPGEVNSKIFRGVAALEEWFDSTPEGAVTR
jgi:hypothetical protein